MHAPLGVRAKASVDAHPRWGAHAERCTSPGQWSVGAPPDGEAGRCPPRRQARIPCMTAKELLLKEASQWTDAHPEGHKQATAALRVVASHPEGHTQRAHCRQTELSSYLDEESKLQGADGRRISASSLARVQSTPPSLRPGPKPGDTRLRRESPFRPACPATPWARALNAREDRWAEANAREAIREEPW